MCKAAAVGLAFSDICPGIQIVQSSQSTAEPSPLQLLRRIQWSEFVDAQSLRLTSPIGQGVVLYSLPDLEPLNARHWIKPGAHADSPTNVVFRTCARIVRTANHSNRFEISGEEESAS